jgi:hypothetical protein
MIDTSWLNLLPPIASPDSVGWVISVKVKVHTKEKRGKLSSLTRHSGLRIAHPPDKQRQSAHADMITLHSTRQTADRGAENALHIT